MLPHAEIAFVANPGVRKCYVLVTFLLLFDIYCSFKSIFPKSLHLFITKTDSLFDDSVISFWNVDKKNLVSQHHSYKLLTLSWSITLQKTFKNHEMLYIYSWFPEDLS